MVLNVYSLGFVKNESIMGLNAQNAGQFVKNPQQKRISRNQSSRGQAVSPLKGLAAKICEPEVSMPTKWKLKKKGTYNVMNVVVCLENNGIWLKVSLKRAPSGRQFSGRINQLCPYTNKTCKAQT